MAEFNKMPGSSSPPNGSGGNGHSGYGQQPNPIQSGQPGERESSEGLVQVLVRQWIIIAIVTATALVAGIGYLIVSKPVWTASSKVLVTPMGAKLVGTSPTGQVGSGDELVTSDFLSTECDVITSNPVLALALKQIGDVKTLRGEEMPIKALKSRIVAEVSKKNQTIDVSINTPYKAEASMIVDAVVEAYATFESQTWKNKVKDSLDVLEKGRRDQIEALHQKQENWLNVVRKNGVSIEADPDKSSAHQRVVSLSEAVTKAHLETIQAKSAYDQAARPLIGDPAKLALVEEIAKQSTSSSTSGAQLALVQTELFKYQTNLAEAQRNYMPNHPIVKTIQSRIDQLSVQSAAAAQLWWSASEAGEDALQKSLDEARTAEIESQANSIKFSQFQQEIAGLEKADDINTQIKNLEVIRGAGATNITVLDPAEVNGTPSPQKSRTLAIAMVLGLIAGLGIGCIRDWMDDRLRSIDAIRTAIGVPVLGAVPTIITAYTAADRGQIVHHDPFGEASESYRTLRTALQFGLPKGTKTLLVTSAVPGEGKSTLVSNLAIAIAQSNKRVLVIDADFRAPMQHRLFGLKDRVGFSSVLSGNDTIEKAIQRTEMEGLDVLPCGPVPTNPAEMLNDASFTQHLNDLADRYDLILLDSPPVTAVTDARIIAASSDATLMVIRPEISTRKQAEQARDGLRGVGARLIGVAVNGVAQAANYGGATGYYSRSDAALAANAGRTAARREMGTLKPVVDPGSRS